MANAKKCDRCKQFYEPYRGVSLKREGSYYRVNSARLTSSSCKEMYFDLCPSCVKTIATFLNVEVVEDAEGSEEE